MFSASVACYLRHVTVVYIIIIISRFLKHAFVLATL